MSISPVVEAKPTTLSPGFNTQSVFSGLAILPIHFIGDTLFTSYSITPTVASGLSFNTTSGILSGIYTGAPSNVNYQVTGTNSLGSVSTSFTLAYKGAICSVISFLAQSEANVEGLTACYYAQTNGFNLFSEEWFYSHSAETCQSLETLDLTDNYYSENEHTWPGLDNSIEDYFSASITGYLNIGSAASYDFTLSADDGASLYFDDATSPLIDIEGQSPRPRSETKSITLSSGRHLIRIYYVNNGGAASLKLEYESTAAGLPRTVVDKTVTFVGGRAPSFLSVSDVSSVVNSRIATTRPLVSGSHVTSYSVTPSLPFGLTFNSMTGVISGSPDTAFTGDYTITALGLLGQSQASIHIVIGGSPVTGLSAKYYSLQNSQRLCQMSSFSSSMLSLLVDTTDDLISHPELPNGSTWNRIPGDVFARFYVVWKGYVRIDAAGDYEFQLSNRDGARLTVNGDVVIDNWGCLSEMTDKTGSVSFDSVGYAAIEVEFFSNNNDFGVILSWKKPSDEEFAIIPSSVFYHLPEATFTYATKKTHYYRYVQILGNTPVFFGVPGGSPTYTITPALPTGLMLQSSGMITGSPAEDSEETTYTITATMQSGTVYTTTVTLMVTYVVPPSDLTITNEAGEAVTSLTVEQFKEIPPIVLSAQNNPRNWSFDPDLPSGLRLDWRTRRIQGAPTVSHGQREYSIIASNNGGSISRTIFLTITGCSYGKWLYSILDDSSRASFTLKNAQTNETVYNNDNVSGGYYGVRLCIPNDDYTYTFTCRNDGRQRCNFQIVREDLLTFLTVSIRGQRSQSGSVSTIIKEKPTITASESELVLAARQRFSISFTTSGMFKPLFVEPALPSTVALDTRTNILSGYFAEKQTYVYTIVAENDKGQARVAVTFNVGTCSDNKSLITFSRSYGYAEESVIVTSESGEEILNTAFSNDAFSRSLCMANGDYKVVMKTSRREGSWTTGMEMLVKDSWEDLLASTILDNGEGEKTEYITINYAIMDRFDMKFYNSAKAPASKWNTVGFNDNSWTDANHDNFGNFTANTAYFRKEFTVDNKNKYPIFAFDLEIYDGVIAYINGKEVVRRNMAAEGVSHASFSASRYDSLFWRRTSVPTSALQNGKNVLAVELHRSEGVHTGITFDMYASLLSGECMKRTDRGKGTDSAHTPNNRYLPAYAFDDSAQTTWRDSNLPVYLQFTYNYDRFEYINKIVLRAGGERRQLPKKFDILGMTSEDEGDVLTSVDDRNLFESSYATATVFMQNTKSYNAYRMLVEETNDDSNAASVAEMTLYTCNIVYCPKEKGWNSIMTGESTFGACPRNTFGESQRSCSLNKYDPSWSAIDYSNCLSTRPSSNAAYIDFKYMVSNCTLTNFNWFVESRFIDITRDILLAKKENIKLYLKRDCSDSETINVCFNVRVTTDLRIADYVFENMNQLQEQMSYRMYTDPPRGFPSGMYFIMMINPLLRTPTSKLAVVVVVILVLIIVLGTALIVYNIRSNKRSRKVRGGTVHKRATIENLQEKMERTRKEKKGLLVEDD